MPGERGGFSPRPIGQEYRAAFNAGLPGAAGGYDRRESDKQERVRPAGVSELQWNFLHEAWQSGVHARLKPNTAITIAQYFTTDKTYDDLAKEYGVSGEAVRQRIVSGIGKMRRILYKSNPQLAQKDPYPLAEIQKGKEPLEIARTEKSRQRRRDAGKKGGGGRHTQKDDVYTTKTDLF